MGSPDKIGDERVQSVAETGSYIAVVGNTYKVERTKSSAIVTDFFLTQRQDDAGNKTNLMKIERPSDAKEGEAVFNIEFLNDEKGQPKTFGIIVKYSSVIPNDTHSDAAKNFFATMKRKFARAFGAFDEKTSAVQWSTIQAAKGRLCTLKLVERNNYLNVDATSIELYERGVVRVPSIDACYDVMEAQQEERKAQQGQPANPDEPPF